MNKQRQFQLIVILLAGLAGLTSSGCGISFNRGPSAIAAIETGSVSSLLEQAQTTPLRAFTYERTWATFMRAQPAYPLVPVVTGGSAVRFSASALPAGLTLDANTGIISGTPSALVDPAISVTITAEFDSVTLTTTIQMRVLDGYVVDSTWDEHMAGPVFNNICSSQVSAVCTLRAAIEEANNGPNEQVIYVPNGDYGLTLGELQVSDNLTIVGESTSVVVFANSANSRVVHLNPAVQGRLSGLTLQGGDPGGANPGGGIYAEAGSILHLSNVMVRNNRAGTVGGGIAMGANGTMNIEYSIVEINSSSSTGGGIDCASGSVCNIRSSVVRANSSTGNGGGLALSSTGAVLESNFIYGNSTTQRGGGVYFGAAIGNHQMINNTISNNSATFSGGGVHSGSAVVTMVNQTFNANMTTLGGAAIHSSAGRIDIANSIFHSNLRQGGSVNDSCGVSGAGSLVSLGSNLLDANGTTGCTMFSAGMQDLLSISPQFSSPTPIQHARWAWVLPLETTSPALSLGNSVYCPTSDQRGMSRAPGKCDIGAYEL